MDFKEYVSEAVPNKTKWTSSLPKDEAVSKAVAEMKKKNIKNIDEEKLEEFIYDLGLVKDYNDVETIAHEIKANSSKYGIKVAGEK